MGADGAAARILLVEDHEDTGRLIARLLKGAGYGVDHAVDVRSAIELFGQKQFDLVLSDLSLPDGSGLDLMRQIRSLRAGVPGICLSGYDSDSEAGDSREAGFVEHLTKPVELSTLHACVARVIAQRAV